MAMAISASEANRSFSKLLGAVTDGGSFTITAHGRPVAQLVPFEPEAARHRHARAEFLAHLEEVAKRPMTIIGPWTRDELHED